MRSIEQQRAANVLQRVNELTGTDPSFKKHYRSYVDRLGPAIVMNGLGQALATERAAAGERKALDQQAHQRLYDCLQEWLCRDDGGVYRADEDLLQAIMENDQAHYLRAQVETLAWLDWHKKCCRAALRENGRGDR